MHVMGSAFFRFILFAVMVNTCFGGIQFGGTAKWKCVHPDMEDAYSLAPKKYLCCENKVCTCQTSCPNALYCSTSEEFKEGRSCSVSLKDNRYSPGVIAIMLVVGTMPVTVGLVAIVVYGCRNSEQQKIGSCEEANRQEKIARHELEDRLELERLRGDRHQLPLTLFQVPPEPRARAPIPTPAINHLLDYDEVVSTPVLTPVVPPTESI